MQGGRAQGRAEEWWQLGRWQGALPGRTGSKETAPQTVSERFPAGKHSLSLPPKSLHKVSDHLLMRNRLHQFSERKWIWTKHVLDRKRPCFPNRLSSGGGNKATGPEAALHVPNSGREAIVRLISLQTRGRAV